MPSLGDEIMQLLRRKPGLTDREITDLLRGRSALQQPINSTCRNLERRGQLRRERRSDNLIGNYAADDKSGPPLGAQAASADEKASYKVPTELSEDIVKAAVAAWLRSHGWEVQLAEGRAHGIDIEARRGSERWVIEAKGLGSSDPMRVNYFLAVLGCLLQRMSDDRATYSIALPDHRQFERLWMRLPALAKQRTGISLLLVSDAGQVRCLD